MKAERPGSTTDDRVLISDPWTALRSARRRYAQALARRLSVRPGDPGYHDAIHEVGVAWAQVRRWERVTQKERPREASG